ncbi:hypothetical protein P3X46_025811 [Hevea brasiliensis]|uniref:Uncharacterized protein n=1 Tax=Hevea brasiliensis TaxID=3981 RepID=A0ABQ9L6V6_HEVBR|nr:uncharacterized protein LOC110670814 isoform X2 [Hevea brasiliensis]XP_021688767.2 uncharacterized protein LOC110670814 isoform X2 [Hevea brasiliensis]XP_021688768.2 uncharacterized protein LOC110670814 isoform X2 [Hevea brasiliensis]XP_021688770.2 uncharacterized protein LOC110670814 isoform X2 [Hevea brasiliensis]KAJ9160407.1 hypothetical protein P3X46_025811 [Hevea brasiliensis]
MGKIFPSAGKLQELNKIVSSHKPKRSKAVPIIPFMPRQVRFDFEPLKLRKMEVRFNRVPLSQVVSECTKRWFQDTLKEAKAGDIAMQVLVGQMYYNGYGVSKNVQKGHDWINKASKSRASARKVSDKRPAYNASDSDSDEEKGDASKNR